MKKNAGWTHLPWSAVSLTTMLHVVWLLGLAMTTLPAGTAYAVFTAIGTMGTVMVGWAVWGEPLGGMKLVGFLMVLGGVVLLRMSGD